MNWKTFALVTGTLIILPLSTIAVRSESKISNIQESNNTMQIAQRIKHGKRSNRGERMNKLLQKLDLTSEQSQQIEAIQAQSKDQAQDLHQQMKTTRQEMHSLLSSDATSEQIREQHQQAQTIHEQLSNNRLDTMLEIREILTPEQRTQIAELMQQHRDRKSER